VRILWVGDSPTVSTGFAKCTRFACNALHAAGHDITILGINEFGDPHSYPYPIYPAVQPLDNGFDQFGVSRLPSMIERVRPDLVIILNDPWNIPAYFDQIDIAIEQGLPVDLIPPVIGWLAVDSRNQRGSDCNRLAHAIVWTEFGAKELLRGGYCGGYSIVPLGVDLSVFNPRDKAESRAKTCPLHIPPDAFIIGVVGRNQPRKRLDLTIEYFAEFLSQTKAPDAYLYLHVAPTGERGCDIKSLVKYYNLTGKVILSSPAAGSGIYEEHLPWLYSSFDVYLSTSQGEGFGLPALEAAACGVPIVVPDCGGFSSWIPDGNAIKVPCSSTVLTAPLNSHPYTIGGIPDRATTVEALARLYVSPVGRLELSCQALEIAQGFTWELAMSKLVSVVGAYNLETATVETTSNAEGVPNGN
jgi:D-inositol-3-phosphate glycosyltransferase